MPAEKRNVFLDADDSQEDTGYESEEELQKGGRSSKRRRVEAEDASKDDDDESLNGDEDDAEESDHGKGDEDQSKGVKSIKKQKLPDLPGESKLLTKKNLVSSEKAKKKSGVIYISRCPPFIKVQKIRNLLEPYGTINRIFLSPEDPEARSRRKKGGGNKKKSYTDGWVEFVDKQDAKACVELLNGRCIGGKKGSFYRDDIWSMVYLKGFKWMDLIAQISAEAAEKETRMRAEISKTTRENKEFERNVTNAKMLHGIQSKVTAKKEVGDDKSEPKSLRKFEQASVVKKKGESNKLGQDSQRVASMLF